MKNEYNSLNFRMRLQSNIIFKITLKSKVKYTIFLICFVSNYLKTLKSKK